MKTATLIYHLQRHGLPWKTRARRTDSVRMFQRGFAYYDITIDGVPGPQTEKAFKYSAARGYTVSRHFKLREFRCGCNGRYHFSNIVHVHRDLIRTLEKTRTKLYPGGLRIVSGWRCRKFNALIGGHPQSAHVSGRAADIPAKHSPNAFLRLGWHGIGYKDHGLVTHVDIVARLKPDTAFKE